MAGNAYLSVHWLREYIGTSKPPPFGNQIICRPPSYGLARMRAASVVVRVGTCMLYTYMYMCLATRAYLL